MSKIIDVTFPGGLKVDAQIGDVKIPSDQPVSAGGDNSAPQPFELFLASLATCAGVYAVSFCRSREIDTEGMTLTMSCDFDPEVKRYTKMAIHLHLPDSFPEKHKKAIIRSMDLCTVKKHMLNPPEFEITADFE